VTSVPTLADTRRPDDSGNRFRESTLGVVRTLPPGAGAIHVSRRPNGHAVIAQARAASPLRFFTPRAAADVGWIVTSTLGGGLVGGDHVRLTLDIDAGTRALLTTQASTKVYRSAAPSCQSLDARVAEGALLAVLPDPIVPFAGSTFRQRQTYLLAGHASLVALDWFTSGRRASGERWAFDEYVSRLDVIRAGTRVFRDHLWLSPADGAIAARQREYNAYAIALLLGPAVESIAADLLETMGREPILAGAPLIVSAAPVALDPGGVVVRAAAVDVDALSAAIRRWLEPVVALTGVNPWSRRW
jgi:urease accessory protein